MNFTEALQQTEGLRLTYGSRWLVGEAGRWIVYCRLPYARHDTVLVNTSDKERAVAVLIKGRG